MSVDCWLIVTGTPRLGAVIGAARALGGTVTAVVIGDRGLADQVAASGPDEVRWVEPAPDVPAEAYAGSVADLVTQASPRVLMATAEPAARSILGAAAVAIGAALLPGALAVTEADGELRVDRAVVNGEAVETLRVAGPVALIVTSEDVQAPTSQPAPVSIVTAAARDVRVSGTEVVAAASGLDDAERVVSFGRGLHSVDDVALLEKLAVALGAEIGCTMPVADDLGWLPKDRYIGRSGRHIAPGLYLAVGISGAAQHMEGVRDAKVVAAINNDPEARIFRTADYGVVGDLYEVVPALIDALDASTASPVGH